ncbi:MAG: septum formation family protein [Acidimicrobiales bacterium]
MLLVTLVGLLGAGIAGAGPAGRLFHPDADEVSSGSRTTTMPTSVGIDGTTTTFGLRRRSYSSGDCVRWDQEEGGGNHRDTEVVPCDQPHLIEIGGRYDLTGGTDHYPTDEEWRQIETEHCSAFVEQVLGGPRDPVGRLSIGGLVPFPPAWAAGDRTIWCGVVMLNRPALPGEDPRSFRPDVPKWFPTMTGAARDIAQALVRPPGTCLADGTFAVPCSEPHYGEITGSVDLTGRVATPPAEDDRAGWSKLLDEACRDLAVAYLQRPTVPGESISHFPIPLESWSAGRRAAECAVSGPEKSRIGSIRSTP